MTGIPDKWAIYEQLIAEIPSDVRVEACLLGLHWTLIRSTGVGIAMTPPGHVRFSKAGKIDGMPVAEIARLVRSWDPLEAAVGLAAINSVLNAVPTIEAKWRPGTLDVQTGNSAFDQLLPDLRGKRVTVIGHFPGLEPLIRESELTILERVPQAGDLPDPACEYILPEQDYVLMTGTTLSNKTFPRLLELSSRARVVLVGPSTPLSSSLLDAGVYMLAGSVVTDAPHTWHHVSQGGDQSIFRHGALRVHLKQEDLAQTE